MGSLVAAHGLLRFGLRTLSCGMHVGSSSLTRDQTQAPCFGSRVSPLRHQGSPCTTFFLQIEGLWQPVSSKYIGAIFPTVFFKLRYVPFFFSDIRYSTLNRLQYSVNITIICTGKLKNLCDLLYCNVCCFFLKQNSPFILVEINYTNWFSSPKMTAIFSVLFLDKLQNTYFCRFSRFCL